MHDSFPERQRVFFSFHQKGKLSHQNITDTKEISLTKLLQLLLTACFDNAPLDYSKQLRHGTVLIMLMP